MSTADHALDKCRSQNCGQTGEKSIDISTTHCSFKQYGLGLGSGTTSAWRPAFYRCTNRYV